MYIVLSCLIKGYSFLTLFISTKLRISLPQIPFYHQMLFSHQYLDIFFHRTEEQFLKEKQRQRTEYKRISVTLVLVLQPVVLVPVLSCEKIYKYFIEMFLMS